MSSAETKRTQALSEDAGLSHSMTGVGKRPLQRLCNSVALRRIAYVLAALLVMTLAVVVRLPAVSVGSANDLIRDAYQDEAGRTYLPEADAYYHVRLAENLAASGSLGDSYAPDGTPMDSLRNVPEGRSVDYQPGLMVTDVAVWRVLNAFVPIELFDVGYWMPCAMAALTALVAFILCCRIVNLAGGIVAGVLAGCAPIFVIRSVPGFFDTNIVAPLFAILLILLLTEAMRARRRSMRIVWACFFALSAEAFVQFWSIFGMIFAVIPLIGGFVFLLVLPIARHGKSKRALRWYVSQAEPRGLLLCVVLTVAIVLCVHGPSFFGSALGMASSASSLKDSGTLPSINASVSELQVSPFGPANLGDWFSGSLAGGASIVNGVGGALVLIAAACGYAAMVALIVHGRFIKRPQAGKTHNKGSLLFAPSARTLALYACVLGIWFAACWYITSMGTRFLEHLAVSSGILAGVFVGLVTGLAWSRIQGRHARANVTDTADPAETPAEPHAKMPRVLIRNALLLVCPVLLGVAIAIPAVSGAHEAAAGSRPITSDATARAMAWISENAQSPEAAIVSWWDSGYVYEYESGHPTLCDGGENRPERIIMLARAFAGDSMDLSRDTIAMLSTTGDAAALRLTGILGIATGYDALWETLPLGSDDARTRLVETYGLDEEQAAEIESLMHPEKPREAYVVLSESMMQVLGWIEYYSAWDFETIQPAPQATAYYSIPDGSGALFLIDDTNREFYEARQSETVWRLYFDRDPHGADGLCFELVYETSDPVDHVQVWKVL